MFSAILTSKYLVVLSVILFLVCRTTFVLMRVSKNFTCIFEIIQRGRYNVANSFAPLEMYERKTVKVNFKFASDSY